jgi:gamma-butyrobetaine dioxygenase
VNPSIQFTERWLRLVREDGHESAYPAIWLYDNCPEHRDRRTGQRLVDIIGLPADPQISRAELQAGAVQIQWAGEADSSKFAVDWLLTHCRCNEHTQRPKRAESTIWSREEFSEVAWMDHSAVMKDQGARRDWLRAIARYGLAISSRCSDQERGGSRVRIHSRVHHGDAFAPPRNCMRKIPRRSAG